MHHDNKDKEKRRAAGQKLVEHIMIESLAEAGIAGATVRTGVSGIGKRGKSTVNPEEVIKHHWPLMIEVIEIRRSGWSLFCRGSSKW